MVVTRKVVSECPFCYLQILLL